MITKGGDLFFMKSVICLVFFQGLFLIFYLGFKWFRVPFPIFPTIFRAISFKWISSETACSFDSAFACFLQNCPVRLPASGDPDLPDLRDHRRRPQQPEAGGGQSGMVTIKFKSESPTFKENLNQVSSVSLLMTSSTGLANQGLF